MYDISSKHTLVEENKPSCGSLKNIGQTKMSLCFDSRKDNCPFYKNLSEKTDSYKVNLGLCLYDYRVDRYKN